MDGGSASLAIHAFDALSGTLDGLNSAGLVVSIIAGEEAMAALGPWARALLSQRSKDDGSGDHTSTELRPRQPQGPV